MMERSIPLGRGGTPEEARPNYAVDLATVHVAIYDAVMAIAGTHQPYAIPPASGSRSTTTTRFTRGNSGRSFWILGRCTRVLTKLV